MSPSSEQDRPLHDAVTTALTAAGLAPRFGRPAGTTQDTIVEIGSDPHSWAVLPAGQVAEISSPRVRVIPLKPVTTITGSVIVPTALPHRCGTAHVAAFRDAA